MGEARLTYTESPRFSSVSRRLCLAVVLATTLSPAAGSSLASHDPTHPASTTTDVLDDVCGRFNAPPKGTGLAQFVPSTWARYGSDVDGKGTADPRGPHHAIATRAAFRCELMGLPTTTSGRTGGIADLAPASYDAAPATATASGGIPPAQETMAYVHKTKNRVDTNYSVSSSIPRRASAAAQAVIQAAEKYVTAQTPYAYGGGTLNGPSAGIGEDAGVIGFDCSGLIRYAYYQGSGRRIVLPRTAQGQYDVTKDRPIAVGDLQPGDLMFWGPGLVYHVALYIGDGKMIEAPQSGQRLTVTNIRTNGDYAGAHRVLDDPPDV